MAMMEKTTLPKNKILLLKLISDQNINSGSALQFLLFLTMASNRQFAKAQKNQYDFFRTTYGPFSENVLANLKDFIKEQLVDLSSTELRLTPKGKKILEKHKKANLNDELQPILCVLNTYNVEDKQDFILALRKATFTNKNFQNTAIGETFNFAT